jgi:hypothetical protein
MNYCFSRDKRKEEINNEHSRNPYENNRNWPYSSIPYTRHRIARHHLQNHPAGGYHDHGSCGVVDRNVNATKEIMMFVFS